MYNKNVVDFKDNIFIFDFDSTFVKFETLDELAKIALINNPLKDTIVKEIQEITNLGMEGKITFKESLKRRISLFSIKKEHLEKIINMLKNEISDSIKNNKDFFLQNSKNIYIISGGFKECILPIVKDYGIDEKNIFALDFIKDENGDVKGIDEKNIILSKNGKAKILKKIKFNGIINMIGDGITDYQIKKEKIANNFFLFTENIKRESLVKTIKGEKSCFEVNSFEEILNIIGCYNKEICKY